MSDNVLWEKSYFLSADVNELLCPLCSVIDQKACEHGAVMEEE